MAFVNFEVAASAAASNPKAREAFAAIGGQFDVKKIDMTVAEKARPFVSQIAWAIYFAYRAIVLTAVMKLELLKRGLNEPSVIDTKTVANLIAIILPDRAEYIQKTGPSAYHYLLDELESRLLEELQKMLQGVESNKISIEQAATILKESERVMKSLARSQQSTTAP
jgi:hypothetical protein